MNTIYLEHYETYLISAPIEDAFIMKVDGGGGHRNCFGVTLGGGVTGYVKPDNGTTLSTTAVLNEVAAWETAKLLGWSHPWLQLFGGTISSPRLPTQRRLLPFRCSGGTRIPHLWWRRSALLRSSRLLRSTI